MLMDDYLTKEDDSLDSGKRGHDLPDFCEASSHLCSIRKFVSSCALPDTVRLNYSSEVPHNTLKEFTLKREKSRFPINFVDNNTNPVVHSPTPPAPLRKFTATMPPKGSSTKPASKKPTTRSAISDVVTREYTIHLHKRVRKILV